MAKFILLFTYSHANSVNAVLDNPSIKVDFSVSAMTQDPVVLSLLEVAWTDVSGSGTEDVLPEDQVYHHRREDVSSL